ncbi:MAG TPA: cytochrome c biogenesis protein CcsA [Noviherbaspirillum sp.]|uniref:cytochrome c biogenesis protein CcsA n=1 Tax=Noviherbaspirillum sp. TaxID=1926288 RepID=UPI002D68F67F|nr:cytochrome c biogenesis protein CcsA [Noviherbaspirillum sp.]HYD94714.1 cytochrome c biogenesis protein CcsA [Noviherbaspirillum sp.]
MNLLNIELLCFWTALTGYSVATAIALYALVFRKRPERTLLALMACAWLLHTGAIGARWERLGHLPFINIFEMLSANVWGLMAAVVIGYWLLPKLRHFAAVVLPVVMLVMAWMLLVPREASSLPPTYHTVWLFIHIAFIKLFLGAAFIALGLSVIVLLRTVGIGASRFASLPDNDSLDGTAYRCMALALIFDTLGIVAGSIWAQDAWGRYWSWDKLEVWSLVTWLSIGLTLHVRRPFRTLPHTNAVLIVATFVIAFFTFFGIPFVSKALHQGIV